MMYCRQRRRKRVSHADDWLMTYADLITLLLCFFVLLAMTVISQKKNESKVHAAQKIEKTPESTPSEPRVEAAVDITPEQVPPRTSLPEIVDNLKPETPANIEQNGDRITSLEISSAAFFDRGSAILSPAGKAILRDVAENLKATKFQDYQVTVEGHTDDAPISTSLFPSNWELSTARAAAVVRFFLDEGIAAQKLRASGYADTFPKVPNRDASGRAIPENQAQNRRVVIKLEKIEKHPDAAS
jgi:chemotaxis protein MotB